jgi:hypothetical protein
MSFKGKVKALLEGGEGKRGQRPGGKGKSRVVAQFTLSTTPEKKGEQLRSKINKLISNELGSKKLTIANAQHNGHAAKPKKSQTENSNHPFYQKVKALSRGKKNNSLLERKSKIIKVLIARIKPCEKKMDGEEEKSKMDEEKKKSKKKHWEPSFIQRALDSQEDSGKPVRAGKPSKGTTAKQHEEAIARMLELDSMRKERKQKKGSVRHPLTGNSIDVMRAIVANSGKKSSA